MSELTDRLSKIDTLDLSDKINKERKVGDMKDFVLVSFFHSLQKQKFSDSAIEEMLAELDDSSEIKLVE